MLEKILFSELTPSHLNIREEWKAISRKPDLMNHVVDVYGDKKSINPDVYLEVLVKDLGEYSNLDNLKQTIEEFQSSYVYLKFDQTQNSVTSEKARILKIPYSKLYETSLNDMITNKQRFALHEFKKLSNLNFDRKEAIVEIDKLINDNYKIVSTIKEEEEKLSSLTFNRSDFPKKFIQAEKKKHEQKQNNIKNKIESIKQKSKKNEKRIMLLENATSKKTIKGKIDEILNDEYISDGLNYNLIDINKIQSFSLYDKKPIVISEKKKSNLFKKIAVSAALIGGLSLLYLGINSNQSEIKKYRETTLSTKTKNISNNHLTKLQDIQQRFKADLVSKENIGTYLNLSLPFKRGVNLHETYLNTRKYGKIKFDGIRQKTQLFQFLNDKKEKIIYEPGKRKNEFYFGIEKLIPNNESKYYFITIRKNTLPKSTTISNKDGIIVLHNDMKKVVNKYICNPKVMVKNRGKEHEYSLDDRISINAKKLEMSNEYYINFVGKSRKHENEDLYVVLSMDIKPNFKQIISIPSYNEKRKFMKKDYNKQKKWNAIKK